MVDMSKVVSTYSKDVPELLIRASSGDVTVLAELRSLLETKPEIWKVAGDLAKHAEHNFLGLFSGKDLITQESVRLKLADLKDNVAGSSAVSPIEELLVQRVVITWLQVHHADMELAKGLTTANNTSCGHAQRRLDGAHKRYLHAIHQLATVRKLLTIKGPQRPAGRPRKLLMAEEVAVSAN